MPGVDAERLIVPVIGSITSPVVELNTPSTTPVMVAFGLVSFTQKVVDPYVKSVVLASTRIVCDINPTQPPTVVPGVVYVTAYNPGVDASKSITPVDELSTSPEVELNAPPNIPVITGVGSASTLQ